MTRVTYYTADGRKAGEETYETLRQAQQAARQFVSRSGLNTYKRAALPTGGVKYFHSYGEREAIVRGE